MGDQLRFFFNRISERLWVKPLLVCILSIAGALLAKMADQTKIHQVTPQISPDSIETLLSIISSSMLVIATFAVSSMVSAYSSASNSATPRSFSLVVADDVSQNALSTFIGAFIYSIISLIALKNSYYDKGGRFALFALTLLVFTIVIVTFVRWVDRIARLGRLGATVDKVEEATNDALKRRKESPTLKASKLDSSQQMGKDIFSDDVGYVQRVNVSTLNSYAEKTDCKIIIKSLPGSFAAPSQPIASVLSESTNVSEEDINKIRKAFLIGGERKFDEDPRFGLIVLSEIAGRALSPAVNDPGTAIDIIGTFVRLFSNWSRTLKNQDQKPEFTRVFVQELSCEDLLDDAFTSIARDGAGSIEVMSRLQKALHAISELNNEGMTKAARRHSREALKRAKQELSLSSDYQKIEKLAEFSEV